MKKILVVGNGGREHALAWKASNSPQVEQVFVAPGNGGTALEPKLTNLPIEATDIRALIEFAKKEKIDLTIVGPEAPLAAGIVDQFKANNLACFGPTQAAAQLESSKVFCKNFLRDEQIPTADYATFTDQTAAIKYLKDQTYPIVIKASGLAAGKGVIIANNFSEASQAVSSMLGDHRFGSAGEEVVIEEFLEGEELSFIVMVDGEHVLPLASSQDHKRRDDGDKGPNTGGMGAYSPAPILTETLNEQILNKIIKPTVAALARRGTPYQGFLYAGLMISKEGEAKVLEYNCRLGDPETQPLLFRLRSDLIDLCFSALRGELNTVQADWDPRSAISIVMAAGGYPDAYSKGDVIEGLDTLTASDSSKVFHAGTVLNENKVFTAGGRVLAATALGDTLEEARNRAYALASKIHWPNCFYRNDIGHRALKKEIDACKRTTN